MSLKFCNMYVSVGGATRLQAKAALAAFAWKFTPALWKLWSRPFRGLRRARANGFTSPFPAMGDEIALAGKAALLVHNADLTC